jgi:hypothetical protein
MRVLRHRQGAVRGISDAAVNRGSGGYCRTREITTFGLAWNGCARKTGGLIQCLVSSPIDQAGAGAGQMQDIRPQSGTRNVARQLRSDRMPDVDSPDHSSVTVLISTSRTALNHRCAALHGIAPIVGGPRHTRKQKRRPCENPTTCDVLEYPRKEKAPRRGGTLPKALCVAVLSSLRRRFGVSATARYNLPTLSRCPAALRDALRSRLFIRRINTQRLVSYGASLHCAFTSFAALLR